MKYNYPVENNNPLKAGVLAGHKVVFGDFSQYAVFPVHTRHESVSWFVVNVEVMDELGLPAVIRQEDSFEEAIKDLV